MIELTKNEFFKDKLRVTDEKQVSDLLSDFAPKSGVIKGSLPDIREVRDGAIVMTVNSNIKILYMALDGQWEIVSVISPLVINGTLPNANVFPQSTQVILDDGTNRTLYIKDENSWKLVKIL